MSQQQRSAGRGPGGDELVFVALGGLGEIGMNAYLYGFGPEDARRWLMVDCGITFPEGENDPGIDVILPDVRFIEENRADLAGIVITHAHEDHIGAVIELWPRLRAPVYATPFTAGMLKAKLAEYGNSLQIPIHVIPLDSKFAVGPFDVELFSLAHSIPEMSALAIRTPLGTVFHTGDWKLDPTPTIGAPVDAARMQKLGDEGVLALMIDSTNAFREGISPSEADVARSLAEIIKKAPRRVAVTTFSSNVARVKAVAEAAQAAGRKLVVAGRALHRVIDVAVETGYLPARLPLPRPGPVHLPRPQRDRAAVHRQPGRAARRARPHRRRGASGDLARQGRHRRLLLAHHSRQREGRRAHPERPRPRRLRYPHRQRGAGARLRPSAARRAAPDVPLDAAEDRRADARRGAPSEGAGRAGARDGRAHGRSR